MSIEDREDADDATPSSEATNPDEAHALAEIDRFAEAMDLDLDPRGMDDEDRKGLDRLRRTLVDAHVAGHLVFGPEGQPVFTPQSGNTKPIMFHEPDGAAMLAMDQRKKGHDIAKMHSVLAAMTKEPPPRFANMKRRDLKVCEALFGLFFG